MPTAYPGYTCRLPKSVTALPRVLRDAGYNTTAIGKWHLVPRGERSHAGPFDRWPLGYGFERFYGFLQGDTNQWTPNLVRDNHYVDQPRSHEDGYHLTEDLADAAIRHVLDQQQSAPGKPFYLSFATGAMHAPHHVAPEWVTPYRGRFDGGWERWRAETFARQVATGIVPEGTVLTERPSWVQAWDDLSDDERRMHTRTRSVRGFPHAHRCADRAAPRPVARGRRARQHARDVDLRQRRERRGRHARHRERTSVHFAARRDRRRQPRAVRRMGRLSRLQPLRLGLGVGGQHAVAALEALHLARRHPRALDRALARRHRRRCADRFAASSAMPSTSCRRFSTRAVSSPPKSSTESRSNPSTVRACSRPLPTARCPRRARRSTSSCSARDRSCTTDGRPQPTTSRRVSSTRNGSSRAAATSRPIAGSSSTSTKTSPRLTTSRRTIPMSYARSTRNGTTRPNATTCSRSSTRS